MANQIVDGMLAELRSYYSNPTGYLPDLIATLRADTDFPNEFRGPDTRATWYETVLSGAGVSFTTGAPVADLASICWGTPDILTTFAGGGAPASDNLLVNSASDPLAINTGGDTLTWD